MTETDNEARALKALSFAKTELVLAIESDDAKGIQTYENMVSVRQDEYDKILVGAPVISPTPWSSEKTFAGGLNPYIGFGI